MEYLALLRGINVGGNAVIKMADLKKAVEQCGFTNVRTYIQSGNIIFESDENNLENITAKLEESLLKNFSLSSGMVVKTCEQLNKLISEIPASWRKNNNLHCYIAFIRKPVTAREVLSEIELKEGVDFVEAGDGVLYLSTLLSGITRSGFSKLMARKISKDITIRNFTTVQKLLALMQRT
jgi:uncharacterized protein (DUF1697 family)